ncbi:MAG: nucleotidyltransferase domain-containing protein, partial [Myxococcota bacterium]
EQALRGDANTLETLWSPLRVRVEPLGQALIDRRYAFVSMNILGSFGRYAQSRFRKIERSLKRDEALRFLVDQGAASLDFSGAFEALKAHGLVQTEAEARREIQAVCRSLFDRGVIKGADFDALLRAVADGRGPDLVDTEYRPKNAYNLLRLLHSCVCWLRSGEPMIEVKGPMRDRLRSIKKQQVPIADIVLEAKAVADTLDEEAERSALPERPNYSAADEFLKMCRRESARRTLGVPGDLAKTASLVPPVVAADTAAADTAAADITARPDAWTPQLTPDVLPSDVDVPALRRFLKQYIEAESPIYTPVLWVALTGAHAYGFPSPDSDLDLKGVFVASTRQMLGLRELEGSIDYLDIWEGRELDLTLNDIGKCAALLLRGNGNLIERFLGPFQVVTSPWGQRMAELARGSLSKRAARHYQGFFRGMMRESDDEARAEGRKAKTLLYAYRVALTGIHLLRAGEVVTDVKVLADDYGVSTVAPLIEIKKLAELQRIPEADARFHLNALEGLEQRLADALESSILPEAAKNEEEMEAFVVQTRLARLGF